MSRSAAVRIASRVVLPSRVFAVGLGLSAGVLVVVIVYQPVGTEATPHGTPRQVRLPRRSVTAPPPRSEPPGGLARGSGDRGASRLRRHAPSRPGVLPGGQGTEERHGSAAKLRAARGSCPGVRGPRSVTGSAGTLRAARGVKGALLGPL